MNAWASAFVRHTVQRTLFMVEGHIADNPFHAACLKFIEKLRGAPGQTLSHSVALKRMKMDAQSFQKLIQTLVQQGDIEPVPSLTTGGRPGSRYRLVARESGG